MTDLPELSLEQCIARRLMLDIRRFGTGEQAQPVLELPPELARGLAALQPCGVILFRENIRDLAQCRALTAQLRECLSPRLLIGIDQEGGRVTRLPRAQATSFSGNMALAACPEAEREQLARQMGAAQAEELRSLGINVNFVPCLDVNSNPDNPVIHVRAFGDDPELVAGMGTAVVQGVQREGVAACLKHFPGHGATSEDSHTGLPRVDRDLAAARQLDLAPFAAVIAGASPALVMSAHIQYPALDAETLPGTSITRPATLSRAIITGLLREEMGFAGVVISDALDMAAISAVLSPAEAVFECFRAGVDIALMPLLLRSPASFAALDVLVAEVATRVRAGELDEAEVRAGAARVAALQAALRLKPGEPEAGGPEMVGCAAHRQLEQRIAQESITLLHGALAPLMPGSRVHLLMPCADSARAMEQALLALEPGLSISAQSLESLDIASEREQVTAADAYIVGVSEPAVAAVVAGGAEDIAGVVDTNPRAVQLSLLEAAAGTPRTVLMLYSPYPAPAFFNCSEAVLASYDAAPEGADGGPGPAFAALAAVLLGMAPAAGTLPVRLA